MIFIFLIQYTRNHQKIKQYTRILYTIYTYITYKYNNTHQYRNINIYVYSLHDIIEFPPTKYSTSMASILQSWGDETRTIQTDYMDINVVIT